MDKTEAHPALGHPSRKRGRCWSCRTSGERPPTLSPRETEVLRHLAHGLTVRAVAEQLQLSPKTVYSHKTNLLSKLDIHNRVALARYAIRNGVVSAKDQQRTPSGGS